MLSFLCSLEKLYIRKSTKRFEFSFYSPLQMPFLSLYPAGHLHTFLCRKSKEQENVSPQLHSEIKKYQIINIL